jgi:hypothetical protein
LLLGSCAPLVSGSRPEQVFTSARFLRPSLYLSVSDFPCCLSISCSGAVARSFHFFLRWSLVTNSNQWSRELSAGVVSLPPLVFKWSAPRSAQTPAGLTKHEALCQDAAASVPSVPVLRCCPQFCSCYCGLLQGEAVVVLELPDRKARGFIVKISLPR